jgi:hypothetical protein
MDSSNNINIVELKKELNDIKKEITDIQDNIKELVDNSENQLKILLDIQKHMKLNRDDNVKQNFNFERLEKGFNLEKSFISTCLNKENIIGDINLFKEYYLRSDIIIPFRKSGNQIEYYDNKWVLNDNEHIETIVLENIVNTYLEEIKNEDNESFSNTSSEIKKLKHTNRLLESKAYRKNIIKEIFDLIQKL